MGMFEKTRNQAEPPKKAKKPEKNPLLATYFSSLLSLVLCTAMFLGTTMAWFTSEVTNTGNEIYIGTLDVELEKRDKNSSEEKWLSLSAATTVGEVTQSTNKLFDGNIRWEPGYTSLETVKISNTGDLAFNYEMTFTDGKIDNDVDADLTAIAEQFTVWVYHTDENKAYVPEEGESFEEMTEKDGWEAVMNGDEVATLADILNGGLSVLRNSITDVRNDVATVAETGEETTPTPGPNDGKNTSHTYTIALHMSEEATGEKLMGRKMSLSVKLVAYQATGEKDGTNGSYDQVLAVNNAQELKAALQEGGNVVLIGDILMGESLNVPADTEVKLDLNGYTIRYVQNNPNLTEMILNAGKLTICGKGGFIELGAPNESVEPNVAHNSGTIANYGELEIGPGVTILNKLAGTESFAVDNHGTFSLNGGKLEAKTIGLRVAEHEGSKPIFTMNAGEITADTPVWIQLPGGNTAETPVYTVTVNGGTIQTTKEASAENKIFYTTTAGNSFAETAITINGGKFLGGTVSFAAGNYKFESAAEINPLAQFQYDVIWQQVERNKVIFEANLTQN